MAVASLVGCLWCLDFNYFQAHNKGLDETKASEVPRWRESTVFTPLERDVMEYAEAMSETPPRVTDELSARLLDQLGAPATKAATSASFERRPMYAALRAIPIPNDVVARLFHAASLLREHRGDGHIAGSTLSLGYRPWGSEALGATTHGGRHALYVGAV